MNQEMIRENAIDRIRNENGLIDVIQWFPRAFLQGYTDALVRVIPYPNAVYIRVYDGGYLEEITFEDATKLKA
jgi:hypothetical protein